MKASTILISLNVLAACLVGCNHGPTPVDAGHVAPDGAVDAGPPDGGPPDAGPSDAGPSDAGPPDAGPPDAGPAAFMQCVSDGDCPGEGARCLTDYVGGLCTFGCGEDADCARGVCQSGSCVPRCSAGGQECDLWGSSCEHTRASSSGYCRPACYESDRLPAGELACDDGLECDPWRNRCVDPATLPTSGGDAGDACTSDEDCRSGDCILEVEDGAPTGYLGGFCAVLGWMPPDEDFVGGAPLPRSTCPDGSVIDPYIAALGFARAGDSTRCMPACTSSADCRPGYACQRGGTAEAPRFTVGACEAIYCELVAGTAPVPGRVGGDCPGGYTCMSHICAATTEP